MSNDVYKRKTESERQAMFAKLAHDIGHVVINITPPTDKSKIKEKSIHAMGGSGWSFW